MAELKEDEDLLQRILFSFSCEQDSDIEAFLHNKAVEFEKLSKARTYLVCDENQFRNESGQSEELLIYGYISLALKILTIPESVSNRMRKELDGFSAKNHGEQIGNISCYLIGQLSKNSNIPGNLLSGRELFDFACDVIASSVKAVGGRYMMIECRDKEKLVRFYEANQFKKLARVPDRECPMVQMIRKIV